MIISENGNKRVCAIQAFDFDKNRSSEFVNDIKQSMSECAKLMKEDNVQFGPWVVLINSKKGHFAFIKRQDIDPKNEIPDDSYLMLVKALAKPMKADIEIILTKDGQVQQHKI
ncbi:hypothetical protein [Burkholderia cepacia]|uniref:hypothetical protein n=1 Tax=Burkholderia cepacia TaxID=292 RepID=UPI00158C9F7C|nr:hypothetical protein [Burkholderia cepacia]